MRHTENKVVITGLGVIAPNGLGADEYWHSILNGVSGIKKIKSFDTSAYTTKIAGEAVNFNPEKYIKYSEAKRMSRFSRLAVCAARMSLEDAGIQIGDPRLNNMAVVMGVSVNGLEVIENQVKVLQEKGPGKMSPFTVQGAFPNAAAAYIAIMTGIKGRNYTISTGCSSSLNAIGHAYELVKYNKTESVICGGAEAPITPSIMGAFCMSRTLSKKNDEPEKASRPFDRQRDGYILSEGAAIFVVESMKSARERNAKIYAEITGYGNTSESISMYKMDETGNEAAKTMALALNDAGIKKNEVDYINAHGSSSRVSDIRETRGIKRLFNGRSGSLKISSVKSMIGHSLGIAGGLQTAATLLAGKYGYIPPTINYSSRDPECDLDYVPNEAQRKQVKSAVVNSFGLGGNNASIVLRIEK